MSATTLDGLARDLASHQAAVRLAVHQVVTHHGGLLLAAVRRHASQPRTAQRPRGPVPEGPRALTGGYRRSINRRTFRTATTSTTAVGTNDVRGAALELGNDRAFGNRRSLPYPHYGPALDEVGPDFEAAMAAVPGTVAREDRR